MRTGQASTEQASTGAAITPEAPRPSSACYEYDAFISYAHADRPIAAGIQKGLHRIGRRVGRLHALRVFRDATDLTASPDLWGRVSDAMDRARYLIVVLSPHSARSGWVNKEVGHWLRERGPDRLLFVLADGHLTWDETARRLDPGHSDVALPVLTEPGSLPTEPFYVDVTEDAPWDPAAPLFREKVTDLAAPIHGKPKYELAGEDLRELRKFRRFRRGVLAGLAVLTVVAVAAAFLAVAKQREAERQRNEAIALRLVADGQALLSGARPGSDARALKQILAARSIGSSPDDGALLWALLAQPELLKIVEVPAPDIATAMLSPDGQRVVTGGKDGTVRLWDAGTGRAIGDPIAAHDGLVSAEFTRDGQRIASAGWDDRTARVWDAVDGTPIGVPIPLPAGDMKIAEVSPDGRRIAVATSAEQVGRTGAVRVWDVQTGTPVAASAIHVDGFVLDVAFAPDGQRIAVSVGAPPEGEVRIWDVTTGAPVGDPMGGGDAGMTITAAFSPDGRRVAAGGEDGAVRIWDIETFQELGAPLTGHEGAVASVAFSPDGRRLVTGGADRTVRAWDIESRRQIGDPMTGHQGWVEHVAFTADGAGIASASGSEGVVRVWNIDVGAANHDGVTSVAFAPDVPYFASGGTDGSLKIWSVDGERYGEPMIGHRGVVTSIGFASAGRIVSGGADGTLRVWDAGTQRQVGASMTGHQGAVLSTAVTPDGRRVVSGGEDGTVRIWDAGTQRQVGASMAGHEGYVLSVAISPDGGRVVSGGQDNTVRIWDAGSGRQIGDPISGHAGQARNVAFTPDGRRLVTTDLEGTIRFWDIETRERVGAIASGHGLVTGLAVDHDGRRVATAGYDRTVRLWDVESGRPLGPPITGHTAVITSIAFSSDGRYLVSAGMDDSIMLWPTTPEEWEAALCGKLTVDIGHRQWREWISPDIPYEEVCTGLPVPPDAATGE